jgi:two-component system, NtrC family, response regulator HupR/HoxA
MQALCRRIERVAPIDVSVLVVGESGTGKELVARAIQRLSRRSERRFETVNCGALTRELLLSELFGHERGAFTGAVQKKVGLLGVADGGTVFLDEVGDLPLDAQVMLLRFLQSGEIRPVGSTETRRVDVRVIAATHRNLEAAVEQGTFREDLYYRLRRVVLEVPSLRARAEDIALLVQHFLGRLNGRYGLSVRGVAREALRVLEQHPWRGNVRELEAVLEQAMVFSTGDWITPGDLELPMSRGGDIAAAVAVHRHGVLSEKASLSWRQQEALRIASERHEVRRSDIVARCRISREVARRELVGLVRLGLLRRIGFGRGTRYVRLSFWLTFISDAAEWALAMI